MKKKRVKEVIDNDNHFDPNEAKIEMIKLLIPLGLDAIKEVLEEEVNHLAGERYRHNGGDIKRWGKNNGSVYLGNQKVKMKVPRVRNTTEGVEVPLESYNAFQSERPIDDSILSMVINGVSTRKYEKVVTKIPETFGIKSNSISKKFIKSSSKRLKELLERDLSQDDIVAIFMDGKTFAENDIVIALGVDIDGNKSILGFVETSTENTIVIKRFVRELVDRGLKIDDEILFVIDGAKGLKKGIKSILKEKAMVQRCQWHKRENIVAYLPKNEQKRIRKKLQDAYNCSTYKSAMAELNKIKKELKLMNESAVASLEEGLEETLTLHKLSLYKELGTSFKTTNCIENINRQMEQYTGRVCYWKNSNQRQRWVATALLEIEPKLRKVKGHKYLKTLRERMRQINERAINSEKKVA